MYLYHAYQIERIERKKQLAIIRTTEGLEVNLRLFYKLRVAIV